MSEAGLPTALAGRARRGILEMATQGLGSSRGPHISIKGGRFRLVSATGQETVLPTHYIDMIVVDANQHPSRVYFEGDYDPSMDTPPACFSDNGSGPSTQSMSPQSTTCAVCPNNVRGSDTTFTGKPTTACENRKKLGVIIPGDPSVTVYEFQIPPGSLKGLKTYGEWLMSQGSGTPGRNLDLLDVITRVEFDPDRQFVMKFAPIGWADDERTLQLVEYIHGNGLSDVAVGRKDVAHDPATVQQLLAGRAAPQQMAAPAPAGQIAQGFQLPPRTGAPAPTPQPLAAPQQPAPVQFQQEAAPAPAAAQAPARSRGRPRALPPQQPAPGANAAAPFMAPAAAPQPAPAAFVPPVQPVNTNPPMNAAPAVELPAFLRRDPATNAVPGNGAAIPAQPARFGMVQNPAAPPPAVSDALQAAMGLAVRK